MGRSGAAFVEAEFSRRAWAARYLDVLQDAVAKGSRQPIAQPGEAAGFLN
jgi:hypothetical protein